MAPQTEQTLAGKRGIVTGVGSGIGRAIALEVAARGGIVAGIDLDESAANRTSADAADLSGSIAVFRCDLSSEQQVREVVEPLVADGYTDFLVNSAGIEDSGDEIPEMTADHWDHLLAVNLRAAFLTMKAVLPSMQANRAGSIVNVGSAGSFLGLGGLASYATAKHGLVGLSKSAVAESAKYGVRTNVVCPGPVDTPLQDRAESKAKDPGEFRRHQEARIPQGRYGRPDEVASLAAFLLGDTAAYINGAAIPIDGGLTATL